MATPGTTVNDVRGVMCYIILLLIDTCCVANWRSRLLFFLGRQSGRGKKLIREPAGSAQPGDHRGLCGSLAALRLPARTRPATVEALIGLNQYLYDGCGYAARDRCLTELINRLMFPRWRRRWWWRSVFSRLFVGGWQNCRIGWQFND